MHRCCLAVTLVTALTTPALAAEPVGDWLVSERTAVIRIEPCDTALCGTVVWVKEGVAEQDPKPPVRNGDASKDGPTGIQILKGLKPVRERRWKGEIYNPRDGNTYTGQITLTSADVLNVEGCVLGGFICSGEKWTRTKCEEAPPPARTAAAGKAATTGSAKSTRKPDKTEKTEKAEKPVISCSVGDP